MRRLALLLLCTFAAAAKAPPGEQFQAVISGLRGFCFGVPFSEPRLEWVGPDLTPSSSGTDVLHVDSADGRTVLASAGGELVWVTRGGARTRFFRHPTLHVGTFAVTRNGRVFATLSDGTWPYRASLAVIGPDGALEAIHPPEGLPIRASSTIWDAGDDCTLLFKRTAMTIGRLNGCTGQVLPDLGDFPPYVEDIEPLPNGQWLVASHHVSLYDASGVFIRRIATAHIGVQQVAISRDLQTVWYLDADCGSYPSLFAVAFDDGQPLFDEPLLVDINIANALVIGDPGVNIPVAGTPVLILLALTLALAGLWRSTLT